MRANSSLWFLEISRMAIENYLQSDIQTVNQTVRQPERERECDSQRSNSLTDSQIATYSQTDS